MTTRKAPKKPAELPESRLLHLTAFLLEQSEPVTFEAIREAFPGFYEGSPAAVDKKWTRDKQALAASGVPIRFVEGLEDSATGYLVEPRSYYLEKLNLEPVEAALLGAAAAAALKIRDNPASEALESALRKIAAAMRSGGAPVELLPRAQLHAMPEKTRGRELAALLEKVRGAIHDRKTVRIRYLNNSLEETERDVDIYGYAWRRGVWLFAGYCHLRNTVRVFYAVRVKALRVANPKSDGGEYRIPRDFDIRDSSRQQPWEYRVHQPVEATVRLKGSLAPLAGTLFPRASGVEKDGAEATVALQVTDLGALVRHALYLGPDCELLTPPEGRDQARKILEKLAAELEGAEEVAA